jgi:hypothetical protein
MNKTKGSQTRKHISEAITRIKFNKSRIVPANSKLTVTNVAKEAKISRASIYNNYDNFLADIKSNSLPKKNLLKDQVTKLKVQNKALKQQVHILRNKISTLASINATLEIDNQKYIAIVNSKNIHCL